MAYNGINISLLVCPCQGLIVACSGTDDGTACLIMALTNTGDILSCTESLSAIYRSDTYVEYTGLIPVMRKCAV